MARGKLNQSVKWARAKASARAILISLGVEPYRLKESNIETIKPYMDKDKPKSPKRFRRTKEELEQLKQFTEWQKNQRIENSK